ncbi:MAG: LAGLIDADG family homing endonuclease [Thermoproteota archaeon]|nr:LAGLIDADG family homing endonuclease [Candidatus Brockarchaeota archaeon]
MGGGSAVRQYERRFLQGEPEDTGRKDGCEEAPHKTRSFGEYEVHETGSNEYKLIKAGVAIGVFSEARVEEERILFPLSRGMLLEVSKEGVREIATFEKAVLFGLISSDGSNAYHQKINSKGRHHTDHSTRFYSKDRILIELFDESSMKIYGLTPHHYERKDGLITAAIYSKGVFYDLSDYDVKMGAYEFRVPREHLDYDGKKAYLKGFFSGDGSACIVRRKRLQIRFYSKCKEGLEGLRQILMDLGFHPYETEKDERSDNIRYYFSVPARECKKFMDEIGSFKPEHIEAFREYRRLRGEEAERG